MLNKNFVRSLEKGQILSAQVVEVLSSREVICSFYGNLLRIANHATQSLQVDQIVQLQVKSTDPLEFQIFHNQALKFERVI